MRSLSKRSQLMLAHKGNQDYRLKTYVSDVGFIVKFGMISHLVLVYLLLTLSMLLFNCLIVKDLRVFHMLKICCANQLTGFYMRATLVFNGLRWTYISLINVHFKFCIHGDCNMNIQNNVFGKSQDYNTTIPLQEKRQRAESQLKEVWQKSSLFQPCPPSESKVNKAQWKRQPRMRNIL